MYNWINCIIVCKKNTGCTKTCFNCISFIQINTMTKRRDRITNIQTEKEKGERLKQRGREYYYCIFL